MLSNISSWKEVNFDDGHFIKYNDQVIYEAIDKWSSILIVKDALTNDVFVFEPHIFHRENVLKYLITYT